MNPDDLSNDGRTMLEIMPKAMQAAVARFANICKVRWQVRKSKDKAQFALVEQRRKAQRAEALRQEAAELASKGRWRQDRDNGMSEASEERDGDSPVDCHY